MRKLEDGTYMYDTDSPWSYVIVWSLALFATGLIASFAAYGVFTSWRKHGLEAFELWDGEAILPLSWVLNPALYSIWLISGLRRAIRKAKSKVSHD